MNRITERYLKLIDELISLERVKDNKSFAETIGVSASAITEISKGRSNVGLSQIQKTVTAFPDTNLEWLFSGKGEIFNTKNTGNDIAIKSNEPANIPEDSMLPAQTPPPEYLKRDIRLSPLIASDVKETYGACKTHTSLIPIIDMSAAAGHDIYDPASLENCEIITLPQDMLQKGHHSAIRIKGTSMAPTLQDDSYLISRLLHRNEWSGIKDDNICVITNIGGETYVKRLKNRLRQHGFITCLSDNPDKAAFPDFNLKEEEIQNIWLAEWYLSARMPNMHAAYYNKLQEHDDDINEIKAILEHFLGSGN